jgi:hypothetical protein
MLHENLVFLIGCPRSGSTLLQRMLASHSRIHTHPEPHLITPLAYLGYYATVDKAPFDHVNAAQALRELCDELPRGEEDYLEALRAYPSALYEKVLAPTGKQMFLDKTPAYGLVLPFLAKLYPSARYVVLTRHPLAVLHSVAHSFFAGSYAAAEEQNPIVRRYVPAVGRFLLERPVPFVQVRYEDVVAEPERELRRVFEHLGLEFEPRTVTYGKQQHITKSFGDPMSVERHERPVTDSVDTWATDLLARPDAMRIARDTIESLDAAHLAAWGYPRESIFDALAGREPQRTQTPLNTYRLKKQVLLQLRKNIHRSVLGTAVKKVRYYCDVLLRT